MNRLSYWVAGAGLGAGMMYFFDANRGNRRRALMRGQVLHALAKIFKGAGVTWRDSRHRIYGTAADLRMSLTADRPSDETLVERVRSKMGRYVSHPASIDVTAGEGRVTLSGLILAHEVDDLLAAVRSVKGVRDVENRLEVHKTRENISGLQGGVPRTGEPPDVMQIYWSPTTRLAAGAVGCTLMAACAARRTPASALLGTAGFGLFLRALTNIEMQRLLGLGGGRRGINLQKTIIIEKPVEQVFALLAEPTNYPHFTETIQSVHDLGNRCYQKKIAGPAGAELTLYEKITSSAPNEFVAWRSEPNSAIKYSGTARFVALSDSSTQVQVQATYNPPGGIFSHSAAWLAGFDPKSQMDDVLMRAKSYLETGTQPHDAADPTPISTETAG
jgi:uncharacterized membrane protein